MSRNAAKGGAQAVRYPAIPAEGRVMRQGPLAGRYAAVASMVMLALIPYLALSAALGPLTPIIARQLHMSLQTMSLGEGLGQRRLRGRAPCSRCSSPSTCRSAGCWSATRCCS